LRRTPLWAGAATATSRSEDEEMPTSSAPLTKTNGGYEMRIYDQVVLRAMGEAQTSPLSRYRPTKKETMCHAHQARGSGTCEPARAHSAACGGHRHYCQSLQQAKERPMQSRLTTQRPGAPSDIACLRGALSDGAAEEGGFTSSRKGGARDWPPGLSAKDGIACATAPQKAAPGRKPPPCPPRCLSSAPSQRPRWPPHFAGRKPRRGM
jgi:hypothetical protein